jgi:hypothetical protein
MVSPGRVTARIDRYTASFAPLVTTISSGPTAQPASVLRWATARRSAGLPGGASYEWHAAGWWRSAWTSSRLRAAIGMSSGPCTAAPRVGSCGLPMPRFSRSASEASTWRASADGVERPGCRWLPARAVT